MEQEQVFPSPPASSPTLSQGTEGCQDSERCPCSLCGACYRIWAVEVHVETRVGVEPTDLLCKIQRLVEPAVHNYPEEGWSFASYGFYEPSPPPSRGSSLLSPPVRRYRLFVTMGAECLRTKALQALRQGLPCLQPERGAADILMDVAGHGQPGESYHPDAFWSWVDSCLQTISTGIDKPASVGFGSRERVMENLTEQMRGAPPPPHMV